jgi:hypothetical protein
VLLPDGRILSTGGEAPNLTYYHTATIYEPPYLFDSSDQLISSRPAISSLPQTIEYADTFTIAISSTHSISSASLVRPSAATHQFNMSQRYVPLTIGTSPSGHLKLTAPASGGYAPPGEYLLFVVDSLGVPSVGKWICVHFCDRAAPDPVSISVAWTCGSQTALEWTAPGDDGGSGTAKSYDLRWSSTAITSANFGSATPITAPAPTYSGTIQSTTVGVSNGTTKYFSMKALDEYSNMSGFSNCVSAVGLPNGHCSEDAPAEIGAFPRVLQFGLSRPNPASIDAHFSIGVPQSGRNSQLNIAIYDIAGRLVRQLELGTAAPGYREITWDLRDSAARHVNEGIYFARIRLQGRTITRSVVVIR